MMTRWHVDCGWMPRSEVTEAGRGWVIAVINVRCLGCGRKREFREAWFEDWTAEAAWTQTMWVQQQECQDCHYAPAGPTPYKPSVPTASAVSGQV